MMERLSTTESEELLLTDGSPSYYEACFNEVEDALVKKKHKVELRSCYHPPCIELVVNDRDIALPLHFARDLHEALGRALDVLVSDV